MNNDASLQVLRYLRERLTPTLIQRAARQAEAELAADIEAHELAWREAQR